MNGEKRQPVAILAVRWMIRMAVVSMVAALVYGIWQRVNEAGQPEPAVMDEEVVQLKARVAQLELEVERLQAENERLRAGEKDAPVTR